MQTYSSYCDLLIIDEAHRVSPNGQAYKELLDKFDMVEDSVQRIKFAMAAYNCGKYHVIDAQTLARVEGLDPMVWDDNVEEMILELSYPNVYNMPMIKFGYVRGVEPHTYVRQIFDRYDHYCQFVE